MAAGSTSDGQIPWDFYLIKTDSLGNICYPSSLSQSPSICFGDSFSVDSNIYFTSGTYIDTLKSFYGECDSIVTTHLTVFQPAKNSEDFFSIEENQEKFSGCDSLLISANEIGGKSSITIFPNPSPGKFTIQSTEKISSITITNLMGERIFSSIFKIHNSSFNIDISSQPSGIYFLEIIANSKREMKKIIMK